MNTKTITRRGREWLWPEYDTELIKVFDQVDDIDVILEYCPKRRVAIQAGGACGVWPERLAHEFDFVITFEPDELNYACLCENLEGLTNISAVRFALASEGGFGKITRVDSERTNAGAGHFVHPAEDVYGEKLDAFRSIPFQKVDLVCLDVEGGEHDALLGGAELIERNRPTIVIEEKPLPQGGDYLAARRLLESWGYVERAKVHNDVIFTR